MSKLWAYLQLLRPPNILTAIADVLAGGAVAIGWTQLPISEAGIFRDQLATDFSWDHLGWLTLATMCLYGGGVVLNDYFDASIDKLERPERPIPSGIVSRSKAGYFGFTLLIMGIAAAFMVSNGSGIIALIIAALVVLYDKWTKHHSLWGPLNMGFCRGANLMLGVSILPGLIPPVLFMAVIPVVYIAAITMVSRGEVHGTNRKNLNLALIIYALVIAMLLILGILPQYSGWYALPFLFLMVAMVVPPLWRAKTQGHIPSIGRAVKWGVLGLIALNATLAAGFLGWFFGLLLLLLLPLSVLLAKVFAVT